MLSWETIFCRTSNINGVEQSRCIEYVHDHWFNAQVPQHGCLGLRAGRANHRVITINEQPAKSAPDRPTRSCNEDCAVHSALLFLEMDRLISLSVLVDKNANVPHDLRRTAGATDASKRSEPASGVTAGRRKAMRWFAFYFPRYCGGPSNCLICGSWCPLRLATP